MEDKLVIVKGHKIQGSHSISKPAGCKMAIATKLRVQIRGREMVVPEECLPTKQSNNAHSSSLGTFYNMGNMGPGLYSTPMFKENLKIRIFMLPKFKIFQTIVEAKQNTRTKWFWSTGYQFAVR